MIMAVVNTYCTAFKCNQKMTSEIRGSFLDYTYEYHGWQITLVILIITSEGGGERYKLGNKLKILEHQFGLNKFTIILNFRRKTF